MNFERGEADRPSGNLIIYCEVVGENPLQQEAKIIASNVFVSFLNHNNNLPAITFPPVPFQEFSDLEKFLTVLPKYELCKIPDFQFHDDPSKAQEYINSRLQEVNELVKEYVELCARYIRDTMERVPTPPSAVSDIIEKLEYLEKMTNTLRSAPQEEDTKLYDTFTEFWKAFIEKYPQYPLHTVPSYLRRTDQEATHLLDLYFKQSKAIYFEDYEQADRLQEEIARLTD